MPEYLIEDEKSGRKWIVESPEPPDAELVDKVINYGSLGSQAKGFGKSIMAGVSGGGESLYKLGELAMYANPLEWQARLTKSLTGADVPIPSEVMRSLSEEGRRQREEYQKEAEYTGAGAITRGVGQAIPGVLTAIGPALAFKAPVSLAQAAAAARSAQISAGAAGALGFGSAMSEDQQINFLKAKEENPDLTDEQAYRVSLMRSLPSAAAKGAIEGGTTLLMPGGAEAVGAARGISADTAKKFLSKETLKKVGLGAGKEVIEEEISALGQTAVDIVSTKPELNPLTAPNAEEEAKRWKSLYDQVITTAGVAGVLGAAGAGVSAKIEGDFAKAKESDQINFDALKNAAMEKQRAREAALVKLSDAALLKARVEATASGPFSAQFETEDGEVISKDFATVDALQKFENTIKLKAVGFGKPTEIKKPVTYSFLGDDPTGIEPRPPAPVAVAPQTPTEGVAPKPPSVEQGKPTEAAPAEAPPAANPKLPKDIAGAKPRYGFGKNNFGLSFESDIDRALFIVSQEKPSKADARYVEWLQEVTGEQDVDKLRAAGVTIRNKVIKPLAAGGTSGQTLSIPQQFAPATPAAPAPAAPAPVATATSQPIPSPVAQAVAAAPTPTVPAPAPALEAAPEAPATPRQRTELDDLRDEREKAAAAPQAALGVRELSDAHVEGASLYHGGAEDFNAWASVMYKRYGAKIAPHLNQIYTNIRDPQFLKNLRRDYVPQTQNENVITAANEEIAAAARRDPNLSRETLVKIEANAVRERFSKMSPAARSIATSKVGGFFREWFTANKGLPAKMHGIMQGAGQQLAGYMRQIDSNRVELENAFKNAYGFKMDDAKGDAQIGYVDTVREASVRVGLDAGLPPEVAKHVLKSRELIDKLSNEAALFLETSGADPELAETIRANLGQYLHKSYRVFDDAEYLSSISSRPEFDVIARAMMEDDKNLSIGDARLALERHIVSLARGGAEPAAGVAKSPLSVTASSPLKKRKDLSQTYRKLLGEYETPQVNLARTAFNLAQFVTKQRALRAFLDEGVSLGLISHGENNVAEHTVAIPSESDNRVMDGFYTTPEFADIIAAYRKTFTTANSYLNSLITLSHISKLSNTVLSLRTVVDNLLGQPLWMIASGHFNPAYVGEAVKTIWLYEFGAPGQKASPEYIDLINRGIIADGVGAEQMREALKFIYNNGLFGFLLKTKKDASNAGAVFSKIYNIPDSVVRYIGYKTELDRLSEANPGIPIDDIKDMAAERARATYPTGGNMPKAIQGFRSVPLLGTYAGFWWESQRVLANSVRLGLLDIKSGNPKMRAYGALRLGGVLAALSAGDILKHTIEFLLGTARSEEEEEQDRRNRPWWSRDQDVIYLSKDRKKEATWNPSNILPWNMYRSSLRAIARGASGEDAEPSIILGSINAAKHYFGPLMQQDMFLAAAWEGLNNRDRFGRKIVEDDDDPARPMKLLYHIVNGGLMPGTAKRVIDNILPIARGDTSTKRSEDVTVGGEILKEAGFEVKMTDKQRELADAVYKFSNENKRLEGAFRKVVFREKPITDAEMAIAYGEIEEKRKELYRRMSYALNAKRRAGFSEEEIFDAVKKGGSSLSRGEFAGLLKGVYVPNRPSRDMMQEMYRQRGGRRLPQAVFDKAVETSRF